MTSAERLPRGRHKLSRADVAGRQRVRILHALTEVLTERGYVNTPVAAVLERAGVSRETFYQQFASKQDCFVAALEQAVGGLADAMTGAVTAGRGTPLQRFDRMLALYLDALAADPARARLFLIETYAAGPEAMRRRLALQAQFVDGIAALFARTAARDRAVCEALVGAVISMVTARFVAGDVAGLAAVRKPIVALAAATLA
jgi:Transcriptional regulator